MVEQTKDEQQKIAARALDKARTKEAQARRKAEKAREHLVDVEAQMASAKEAVEQADQAHAEAKAAHSQAMVDVQKVRGDVIEPIQCATAALAHGIPKEQMEQLFSQFLTTLRTEDVVIEPSDEEFGEIKRGLASLVSSAAKRRKANSGGPTQSAPSQGIAAASQAIQEAEQKAEEAAKGAMDVDVASAEPAGGAAREAGKESS